MTSDEAMDEFNLRSLIGAEHDDDGYVTRKAENTADDVLQKLLPVVTATRSAELSKCGITHKGCDALASALKSNPSHLRQLDLSENKVGDSGVKSLSVVLENPHCKLETFRLWKCGVTDGCCKALASALGSNPSLLIELELSYNKLDKGVTLLSDGLKNPHCKLKILRLSYCGVTDKGCAALALALKSNPSHLRELDLSGNKLEDSGVKPLFDVLGNPHCKVEILRLMKCDVTHESCAALASALRSNPSHLRQLYLAMNYLGDSGVKPLFDVLGNLDCKVEILWLLDCGVTDDGCVALASAMRSNPSHLRELKLSYNTLGDKGVKLLSNGLANPHCKLEELWLYICGITDEGCVALASALKSNPSHLRKLDLAGNKLGDSAMKLLSDLKDDPHYKLDTLWTSIR